MMQWFDKPVPDFKDSVLTMGNFDGLHLGHQKVLQELLLQAKQRQTTPVVLTYLEHPGHYVHFKHPVSILTPRALKQALIKELGIEKVFFLNFTSEKAHTGALDFLKDVLIKYFHPQVIVAGHDMHFGYQRVGNADFLQKHETEFSYHTLQIEPVLHEGKIISSSLIRECLTSGDISAANAMLGKPYCLYGTVTHGQKLGRVIGFPTINLNLLDIEQLIPRDGVYLSSLVLNGEVYFGLTNIGTSPTLKNTSQIEIETHILDFNEDIYDAEIELKLLEFIRAEQKFDDTRKLHQAIADDIAVGRKLMDRIK
ncbi:MAG: bifunctional riboflavin kinase/FAD synthetase [Candidatus Cloacimonadaceae bacterium]